nr:DUF1858 domain-containing protein [candidate division Zixibacteria bacterium]
MIKANEYVEDLIKRIPELDAYLMKRGIRCVICGEPVWGTIGELIESKDMNVGQVLAEINSEFVNK